MILTRHPSFNSDRFPPNVMALVHQTPKYLGFWASKAEPHLPNPDDYVDKDWNLLDRARVVHYLLDAPVYNHGRGSSWCRMCHILNGSVEQSDDTYTWPEGFAHYVAVHFVRPPEEFVQHVLANGLPGGVPIAP